RIVGENVHAGRGGIGGARRAFALAHASLFLAGNRRGPGAAAERSGLKARRILLPRFVRQKKRGVDARVVQADGPMQMRAGDTAGLADHAYRLTARDADTLD